MPNTVSSLRRTGNPIRSSSEKYLLTTHDRRCSLWYETRTLAHGKRRRDTGQRRNWRRNPDIQAARVRLKLGQVYDNK